MSKKQWWVLDAAGNPEAVVPRPEGANPEVDGSPYTPWGRNFNHLHGQNGCDGIHFLGTIEEAREALRLAQEGKSELPVQEGFVSGT